MRSVLSSRDWTSARAEFAEASPVNHVVLDNFFTDSMLDSIRQSLRADGGWRQKNWQVRQLFCKEPPLPQLEDIVGAIKDGLGAIANGLELVKHWAVVCHENEGLHVHADNARIAVNVWLTPDDFNSDPSTGGMVLLDLLRPAEMPVHEFNAMPWSGQYVKESGKRKEQRIPYRSNRAIVFDARAFHFSEDVAFAGDDFDSMRLGLTLAFDNPLEYAERMRVYGETGNSEEGKADE